MATRTKKPAARAARNKSKAGVGGRCWKGYEPVPGKKPYSKGSCKKK